MMAIKRNKIILDCDLMRFPHSGLYHYCLNLGNHVNRQLEKNGLNPLTCYVPAGGHRHFVLEGRIIAEKKWHHRFFQPFLWDCAVWHAPFQSGRIIPMHDKRIRVVLTIHDLNCLHEDKPAKERRLSLEHTQRLINRADALVCISEHCKKDVLENLDTGKKKLYVIHNGTHAVGEVPATPKGYRPSRPFVFAMGYVNRKKNFHTLIPLLENQELELVVAGKLDEPDYISMMQRQAEEWQVQDRLKILGPVPEEDKAWYLQHCMAFALPSLAEGFGAPVVEAMTFGKPLFLSNRTSLPEIGKDLAFYFENFEPAHIRQVFEAGIAAYNRNGLAAKIKERGKDFNWEEKAADYCRVYESLL